MLLLDSAFLSRAMPALARAALREAALGADGLAAYVFRPRQVAGVTELLSCG
ncbi:MAG: hypothetical protein DHS20C08_14040 [Rhodomicrobium sp.]|nr:MAG: hypothetical protein DHS20C08_14040 [Rhodomicrobium sp.]